MYRNGKTRLSTGFVRIEGLEPPRLSALDPKSSAATNYAISAMAVQKYNFFCFHQKHFFL